MYKVLTLAAALAVACFGMQPAAATDWMPGPQTHRDFVTGYLCADPACSALYLPRSKCICQKLNPGETELRKLKLRCSLVNFMQVSACPVKSPYGINVD